MRKIAQDKVIVMLFRALLTEYSAGHSKSRKQPILNTRNELFAYFYLQCGLIAFGYHVVTAGGRRSGVTLFPSR